MLRPRKKITKKEMKEDPLVTFYVRVQKFIRYYSKQLNIALLVFAAIIVIGIFVIRSKKKADIEAKGKLGIAEQFYAAMDYSRAINEFKNIITSYAGTGAAARAAFFMANAYYDKGDYENAEKYYKIYLNKHTKNRLLTASSSAGIAACLESKNKYEEAAVLYEKTGVKYSDLFQAPYYLKDSARCYLLAGKKEESRRVLEYLKNSYQKSPLIQEINVLLESL